jgi:hypothetical protein
MLQDLQEFYLASYELGAARLDDNEKLWPRLVAMAEKMEKEEGLRPIAALAQAALQISEAA